jgi:hypothetical protein
MNVEYSMAKACIIGRGRRRRVILSVPPDEVDALKATIAEVQRKPGRKRTIELDGSIDYPDCRPYKRMSITCDPSHGVSFGVLNVSGEELCLVVGSEMSGPLGVFIGDLEANAWDFSRSFPYVGPTEHAYEREISLLYL